jgi:hypothetical protein
LDIARDQPGAPKSSDGRKSPFVGAVPRSLRRLLQRIKGMTLRFSNVSRMPGDDRYAFRISASQSHPGQRIYYLSKMERKNMTVNLWETHLIGRLT